MSDDYRRLQDFYGPAIADVTLVAATQNYNGAIAAKTNYTVYVQRITVLLTTHVDGLSLTFQDTAGTPVPMGLLVDHVVANVSQAPLAVDFGPAGTPLTQGTGLDIRGSAAGLAGRVHIEAYRKLTGVGAA